jgi:hypothetical protein
MNTLTSSLTTLQTNHPAVIKLAVWGSALFLAVVAIGYIRGGRS